MKALDSFNLKVKRVRKAPDSLNLKVKRVFFQVKAPDSFNLKVKRVLFAWRRGNVSSSPGSGAHLSPDVQTKREKEREREREKEREKERERKRERERDDAHLKPQHPTSLQRSKHGGRETVCVRQRRERKSER